MIYCPARPTSGPELFTWSLSDPEEVPYQISPDIRQVCISVLPFCLAGSLQAPAEFWLYLLFPCQQTSNSTFFYFYLFF